MDEKTHFAARLNAGLRTALDEFKQLYEENNDTILKNDKQILEALLDTASSKYAPYKDNSTKIKQLEAEKEQLLQKINSLTSEVEKLKEIEHTLRKQLNEIQQAKQQYESEQQYIILTKKNLAKPVLFLLKKTLTNKKVVNWINRQIEKYEIEDITGKIGSDELENVRTLIRFIIVLTTVIGKTLPPQGISKKFYALIDEYKIDIDNV